MRTLTDCSSLLQEAACIHPFAGPISTTDSRDSSVEVLKSKVLKNAVGAILALAQTSTTCSGAGGKKGFVRGVLPMLYGIRVRGGYRVRWVRVGGGHWGGGMVL